MNTFRSPLVRTGGHLRIAAVIAASSGAMLAVSSACPSVAFAEDPPAGAAPTATPAPADPGTVPAPAPAEPPPVAAAPPTGIALPPPPPHEDAMPIPTLTLDRIPPNTSFEFAIQVSYGTVAYFRDSVPPWVGFGFRGGWGKNFGLHRLGAAATLAAEGDIGVHTQLSLEPALAWDFVSRDGLLLGASAGPSVVWTNESSTVITESGLDLAPTVAARIGYSETWSRVGRRLFLFVEPKARYAFGTISPVVAIAVGSGGGR